MPSAALIVTAFGLQPRANGLPPVVIAGPVASAVHVTVLDTVAVFPQPSIALNVLVCERPQVELDTAPSVIVILGVPQSSVALALPNAPVISVGAGLQPRFCVV